MGSELSAVLEVKGGPEGIHDCFYGLASFEAEAFVATGSASATWFADGFVADTFAPVFEAVRFAAFAFAFNVHWSWFGRLVLLGEKVGGKRFLFHLDEGAGLGEFLVVEGEHHDGGVIVEEVVVGGDELVEEGEVVGVVLVVVRGVLEESGEEREVLVLVLH
jgi:hypothetical protein